METWKIMPPMSQKHFEKMIFLDFCDRGRKQKVLNFIKGFITFMNDHILCHGRKCFCRFCLQVFNTEKIVKSHANE